MNETLKPHMTIEQKRLALLQRKRASNDATNRSDNGIPILDTDESVPASFAQQRLWFLDRLAPGNPFYSVSLDLPLKGAVYPDLLEQSLLEIARRHDTLRTTFIEQDGQPIQVVRSEAAFPMERIDLSAKPVSAGKAALQNLMAQETVRSFDLTKGPLAIARLVKLAPNQHHLLLSLHHIVCDGWSLKVLGRELTAIYSALIAGKHHNLPDIAVQYRDFSSWQRNLLDGSQMAEHRAYWVRQLAAAPELAIPADFERPTIPTYGGAFVPFSLDRSCAADIMAVCAQDGATPFMVLLSAWMVLLGRYADMDDILIAAPSAGREKRELEAMIGFFVNTLVLRGDLSGNPSFRDVIGRTRDTCLEAFSHEEFPFDRLIEELAPSRRGDRNPLAQVIFQLFSAPDRSVAKAAPKERQRGTSKFDLRLDLWDTDDGYSGELEYSTDLFAHATAEQMTEQFQVLLHELLADPDQPITDADMMSQVEYEWLLENSNHTDQPWPEAMTIVDCFTSAVTNFGPQTALSWDDCAMTYEELDRASDGAAAQLAALGTGKGDAVAVWLARSPDMIVAWLGALKVGAAYVPLDIDTPVARVRGFLETVHAAAVVTDRQTAAKLGKTDAEIVIVDLKKWTKADKWAPVLVGSQDIANIMFTSGSTGKPKAVLVPHQGIVRLTVGQTFWTIQQSDAIAQASNCAFDAATLEVWTALLNGHRVVGVDRDELLSPERLGTRIRSGDFNHLFVTTALFHRLIEEEPGIFAPLTSLITGGSRLKPDSVREVLKNGRPQMFANAYGPTEVTTLGTIWPIDNFDQPLLNVPIGAAIGNTTAYVLDSVGRLVPRGVPGELYLGGPGVALGYLDDPQQTARKFGPSPFREGERLYATGDRVRLRHDATIDFLGRYDDQMKIRGFRVEPDEIATALQSHPRVAQAQALISKTDDLNEGRVVAFYVPTSNHRPDDTSEVSDTEAVAYWQHIYDEVVYLDVGTGPTEDAQFEIAGWLDSATGDLLSHADMAEQVNQTCDRIGALGGKDVLEFGCGTGLILFPLAPKVDTIFGIDISERALDHVRQTAENAGIHNISLRHGSAEAVAQIADDSFDTVVLNSTVQYFPSDSYLTDLIGDLLRVTRPGGAIFFGDVRHIGLLETFQSEIAMDRADLSAPASAVWRAIERKTEEEQELLLDPDWFVNLKDRFPQVQDVAIWLKRGDGHNELARFRYDVVLYTEKRPQSRQVEEIDWGVEVRTIDEILARAPVVGAPDLLVKGIPSARTARALSEMRKLQNAPTGTTLRELNKMARGVVPDPISPEQVWQTFEAKGHNTQIGWSSDLANFDILLSASDNLATPAFAGARHDSSDTLLANSPAHGRSLRKLEAELGGYLGLLLPDYMLPQGYVRLPTMPLTANGKVDKKTLAASIVTVQSDPTRPPRTETERQLATIFCEVLQISQIGLDDNFFRLGGHSLKATQVISRIATEFGISVPLRAIFETGNIAGLVSSIETAQSHGPSLAIPTQQDDLDIDDMDGESLERALAALDEGPEDSNS